MVKTLNKSLFSKELRDELFWSPSKKPYELMSWDHCLGQWFPVSKLQCHERECFFCFSFSLLDSTEERIIWPGWPRLLLMIVLDLMLTLYLSVAQPGCVLAVKIRQISFSIACVSSDGHSHFVMRVFGL